MPKQPIVLTYAQLKDYFFDNKRDMYYKAAEQKRKNFLPHSDGEYPQDVIERQRPNEPEIVKQFREQIWEPITKPTFSKIVSSINKIRRSSDWSIKYPAEAAGLKRITEEETLEQYCEVNFPFFNSVTNWLFNAVIKPYLIDPNGVVIVLPLEINVQENEYIEPFPFIYACTDVLRFVPEQYAIIRIPQGSTVYEGGLAFYFINTVSVQRWEQVNAKSRFDLTMNYEHGIGELPVFKLGGVIEKSDGYNFLYESRISGVLPNLNESVAEYTDLQAAKRLHIYPERWQYSQHECVSCNGSGTVRNPDYTQGSAVQPRLACGKCGGLGYVANTGPYSMTIVKPTQAGQPVMPTPPAGFIEKDVEIVKIMDESWRKHIFDALASINFQFLDQTPLSQSGTAKEVDKEELNNTVHAIAEDLVKIMDNVYRFIARYRYKSLYSFDVIEEQMLPSIAVPDHFDLLSSQFMQEEIGKAKASKLNPTIVSAMEIEYTGKRFINEPEVKQRLELILKLDPLPNVSEDEKMTMLSNKGITQLTYVLSSNIQAFVQRAMDENESFAMMGLPEQIKILQAYAQEQMDAQQQQAEAAMELQQQRMASQSTEPELSQGEEQEDESMFEEEPVLV